MYVHKETPFHLSLPFFVFGDPTLFFFPVRREFRRIISVSERQLACGIIWESCLSDNKSSFACFWSYPLPPYWSRKKGWGKKMSNEAQYFAIFYLKKKTTKQNKRCDVNRNRCDVLYRRVSLPLDRCEQYTLECTYCTMRTLAGYNMYAWY